MRGAREQPPEQAPREARPPAPRPEDAPLIALAEALLRARAQRGRTSPMSCSPRAPTCRRSSRRWRAGDAEADVRTLRGWRRELAGAELLALLDGERVAVGRSAGACSIAAPAPAGARHGALSRAPTGAI